MIWRVTERGRFEWLIFLNVFSLVCFICDVIGSKVPKPCTDLKPLYLLDEALPIHSTLPAGVSLIYDVTSHVHAYSFTSDVGVISFPSSRIFTKCDFFPEEFSIFVTLRYIKVPHNEECVFALSNSRTSQATISLRIRRQRIRFQYKGSILRFKTHNLFDGDWHTLGISVSGKIATLTTDCRKIQKKKLKRKFPALLNTTSSEFFIGSCSNKSDTFTAYLKQLFILPGADITARACSKLISGHADMDNTIPLVPGEEIESSLFPENVMCTWKDVGNLGYDFRQQALKVCVNGIWQLVPFTDGARQRLDYITEYQDLETPAPSIDVDVFSIPGEGTFAALANTDPENSEKGMSVVYKWVDNKMTFFQDIPSKTAQSVCHFMIGSQFFLAVANYGNGTGDGTESTIFKWHRGKRKFLEFQSILTWTARDFEYFRIDGDHYLAVANYAKEENPHTDSIIYKWNATKRLFEEHQRISTIGAYDWTYFMVDEFHFLAVANAFNGLSTRIFSAIYFWQMGQFVQFQTMETTGATDFEHFAIGEDIFLAVANAYNYGPQNFQNIDTYYTNSTIYKLNREKRQFEGIQHIPTFSAIDWEFFQVGDESYLIVSNAQNGGPTERHKSILYKWQGIEMFVPVHKLPTLPSTDFEVFYSDGEAYLIYANAKASHSQILKVKLV